MRIEGVGWGRRNRWGRGRSDSWRRNRGIGCGRRKVGHGRAKFGMGWNDRVAMREGWVLLVTRFAALHAPHLHPAL